MGKRTLVVAVVLLVTVFAAVSAHAAGYNITFQHGAPEGGLAIGVVAHERVDLVVSARQFSSADRKINVGARYSWPEMNQVIPFVQVMVDVTNHSPDYTVSGGMSYNFNEHFALVGRAGLRSFDGDLRSFSLFAFQFNRK